LKLFRKRGSFFLSLHLIEAETNQMKKFLFIALAAATTAMIACSKDEGIPDNPTTLTLAKHWFVRVQGPATTSAYSLFSTRTTYYTSTIDTNGTQLTRRLTDTITLDDHNLLSPTLRSHVKINVATRIFGEGVYKNWNDVANPLIIKEGKMVRLGGRSRSGATVDSIYIRYAFQSAPALEYILTGHERTGFLADEY
jgi:hypothetical protein